MKTNYDEYGVEWKTFPRDPATKLVNLLNKKGYQLVVLPRYTYRTGEYSSAVEDLVQCENYIHSFRMSDCLKELE